MTDTTPRPGAESAPPSFQLPADFLPLHLEQRSHVSTEVLCAHIMVTPQTARTWASKQTYPAGLKPIRIARRLGWPVAAIKTMLVVA